MKGREIQFGVRANQFCRNLMVTLALLVFSLPVFAVGFAVNDFGDGGDADLNDNQCATSEGTCTLRAAIEQANSTSGLDTVGFAEAGTVLLEFGTIDITDSLMLGPGQAPSVTISATSQPLLLRITQVSTTVTIEDLTFSNIGGQAIIIGQGPNVTLRRCIFTGNVNSSGSASGGALSVGGSTVIDSCTFDNNSSPITSGGAIFLGTNAALTIRNSTIEDNSAGTGGGIAVVSSSALLELEDTVIRRNVAATDGGGIHSQSRVHSAGVTIYDNVAGGDGGGIWAANINPNSARALDLVGADIRGNTAGGDGGGVFLGSGVGLNEFLLSRSAVWENDAMRGGGVFVFGSGDTIYQIANSTIGLNTANLGGGIFFVFGDLRILHSTVWDNQNEQLSNTGALAKMGNSIIGFESPGSSGCDFPPVQLGPNLASDGSCGASIVGDPELGAITNTGGYAPTQPFADTSPALDVADLTICGDPPIDFFDSNGPGRPQGLGCDLGSWESGASSPFSDGFESGDTSRWSATVP